MKSYKQTGLQIFLLLSLMIPMKCFSSSIKLFSKLDNYSFRLGMGIGENHLRLTSEQYFNNILFNGYVGIDLVQNNSPSSNLNQDLSDLHYIMGHDSITMEFSYYFSTKKDGPSILWQKRKRRKI